MNRREFLKNVGASGMVAVAPIGLSSRAAAETDLVPVGKYFVFAHLGGGWNQQPFVTQWVINSVQRLAKNLV